MVPLLVVGSRAVLGPRRRGAPVLVADLPTVAQVARDLERSEHPRWLVPSARSSLGPLVDAGVRVQRCWDVTEVHRIVHGGWAAGLDRAWASARGLDPDRVPAASSGDLFDVLDTAGDAASESPVRADRYLRADVLDPRWASSTSRLEAVAHVLLDVADHQLAVLDTIGARAVAGAHIESAAALMCLELERDGLPVDRVAAERLVATAAGRRPRDDGDAALLRRGRDAAVLSLVPGHERDDLRNPAQVRELLASVGVTVPSTRAAVLEPFRGVHPVVEALLGWRKGERIATTYGYRWLDEHVGADGRLRGAWTACDGAAGRMTAQNGLHNLPAVLRPAVAAESRHVLVRADLRQVEPRVLAALSGDRALSDATRSDDLYAPVARTLGVDRAVAKVAVLAAMYGQRSGVAGRALGGLQQAYPVAMRFLDEAYASGVGRRPLRTFGGRRINLDTVLAGGDDAARGRFARNAVVQGSAAELFKAWAATVRHAVAPTGAQVVLCLHDELLVHAPEDAAAEVATSVDLSLEASARWWTGSDSVRFVADTATVRRWSDAKAPSVAAP